MGFYAVSYTHLDVYKRQPKETVQGGAPKETAQEAANPKEPVSRITANGDKTVIVVDETSQNDNISNKILDRLTDQLEEEIQGKLDHYHMVNVDVYKRQKYALSPG